MAPPGRPNMTSTPSISRLLMRAWPPFSFIAGSFDAIRKTKRPPGGRSLGARGLWTRALLQKYEGAVAAHVRISVARAGNIGKTSVYWGAGRG
jgi:hypothetical protein